MLFFLPTELPEIRRLVWPSPKERTTEMRKASRFPRCSVWILVGLLVGLSPVTAPPEVTAAESISPDSLEFFERHIRPLFAEHCYQCHSLQKGAEKAGLTLDSRDGLLVGGDSGEAIVPGEAEASLLVEAIRYESYEMPPKGKLPDEDIANVVRWIEMGAPWPQESAPTATNEDAEAFDLEQRQQTHWAWQPIEDPPVPDGAEASWGRNEIDAFILAKLEQAELSPAPPADRLALIRRLSFDLIGLPPTPAQVRRYLRDPAEDAYERLVDELLQSPHFGERWGRHWLDLVRYAESRGHEFDDDVHNAYQYRDYVIRALNADVPYDQFVREHIAGDLLDQPRLHPAHGFNESILGTGFWFLGEWVHSPVDIRKEETDRFDNMIDVMSKTFLGMTVACARCHDHKFDAIGAADYYALSGFLQSSDYRQVRFDSLEHNRRIAEQLAQLDDKYRRQISKVLATSDPATETSSPAQSPAAATGEPSHDSTAPRIVVDYAELPPHGWMQDGFIFGKEPRQAGEIFLQNDDPPRLAVAPFTAARNDSFWNGLESRSEPATNRRGKLADLPRSGRTLRTPTFEIRDGEVGCRVRGEGTVVACVDSHRLVAGPLHGETIQKIPAQPNHKLQWVSLNLKRYIGHRIHLEFIPAEGATLEVLRVVDGRPFHGQTTSEPTALAAGPDNASKGAATPAASAVGSAQPGVSSGEPVFAASLTAGESRDEAARLADLLHQMQQGNSPHSDQLRQLARSWQQERNALQRQVRKESRLAMSMLDGWGEDDHLLIRGSSANPGEVVARRFLAAVDGGNPLPIAQGSGRLALAARINAPDNPLTSRVITNRIWHHLLGRGIVPTPDDFGVLGQRPTHPQLLDHLASWFTDNGASIKQMIRYIVQSSTYRMSSQVDPAALRADPDNRWWHHIPPKRLEGEVIRDALLSISGELETDLFGEPVPIHLTSFMQGRGRPTKSGPLDGDRRRSIYTAVRRNFLSPLMLAFDTPAPFSTMGRRNVSNVPAQALILMNDPFVLERAQHWAARAIRAVPDRPAGRIQWMYETAYARPAEPAEIQIALEFLHHQSAQRNISIDEPALWSDFAHALINSKEFIFLR